jgi:hypothetical protein
MPWNTYTEQGLCRHTREERMVKVGIDLHKKQFTVCVRGAEGVRFEQYPTTEAG